MSRMNFNEPRSKYADLPPVIDQLRVLKPEGAMWVEMSASSWVRTGRVYDETNVRRRRKRFQQREEVQRMLLGGMSLTEVVERTHAKYQNVYNVQYKLRKAGKL